MCLPHQVMYPEAEAVFWSDMRTLRHFARLAQPAYVAMLDEVQRQFSKEFDYRREAQDQEAVRTELLRVGGGDEATQAGRQGGRAG